VVLAGAVAVCVVVRRDRRLRRVLERERVESRLVDGLLFRDLAVMRERVLVAAADSDGGAA